MPGFDEFGDEIPDDRRTGMQGYMQLIVGQDQGADGLSFFTKPPNRAENFPPLPTQPTFIPIRAWASKLDRRFCDVTSSVHYSPDYDLVFSASLPTGVSMEIKAEGLMHLDTIPQTLLLGIMDGASPMHVVLGYDDIHPFFEGLCLVSNFIVTTPADDVISYSCTLRPYGVFNVLMEATY